MTETARPSPCANRFTAAVRAVTRLARCLIVSSLGTIAVTQCPQAWLQGDGFDLRADPPGQSVLALTELPDGDLVAAGYFHSIGGASANGVARGNGTTWTSLGTGIGGGMVRALAVMPNGDLVAGGTFTIAGGSAAAAIARWDGNAWTPLGS